MVDTLLDVSSLETGRLHFYAREYDFANVARRALDEAAPRFADRALVVTQRVPTASMQGIGDPDKLRRAMAHLLDNAVKFTPPSGSLAVEVEERADGFWFRVADSGPGVPSDRLQKVLEPFYQVDGSVTRTHGGVGLGLAFARRVIEAHEGDIVLASPPPAPIAGVTLSGTQVAFRIDPRPKLPEAPIDPQWGP
jgi:signal transduction histidine kinase